MEVKKYNPFVVKTKRVSPASCVRVSPASEARRLSLRLNPNHKLNLKLEAYGIAWTESYL